MKQYHYSDGINSYGPVSLEELIAKNIGPDTLVWSEDLVTWTKAKEVAELRYLFATTPPTSPLVSQPPPTPAGSFEKNTQRPPKTYLIESILTTIFCCWPLGIPSIIYASRVEKKFYAGDIEGAEADSANARKWMIINLIACVVLWIAYFAVFGFAFFLAPSLNGL
ncbi:MAG TPA: CD225/dispanin family protein [Sphingobacterium sp.]|nr:CD225/dispanin family protein [Sphingobacterium sp.]